MILVPTRLDDFSCDLVFVWTRGCVAVANRRPEQNGRGQLESYSFFKSLHSVLTKLVVSALYQSFPDITVCS